MPAESKPEQLSQVEWHRRAMGRAVDVIVTVWPRAHNDLAAIGFPKAVMQPHTSSGGGMTVENEIGDEETVPATAVEIAALHPGHAIAWIAELHDVTRTVLAAAWPGWAWKIDWRPEPVADLLRQSIERIFADWKLDDLIDADPRSANYRRDVLGVYRLADHALAWWPPPARRGDTIAGVTVGARSNTVEVCSGCGGPIAGGRNDPAKRIDGDPFHVKNPGGRWCYHAALRSRGKLGKKEAS